MGEDCTTCFFNRGGFCQRFPPQVILYPTDNQHPVFYAVGDGFPWAMAGRWCGEWKPCRSVDGASITATEESNG